MFLRCLGHPVGQRVGQRVGSSALFLDVKPCLNAIFRGTRRYGKSPCFLQVLCLRLPDLDYPLHNLMGVYGVKNLD
jgi:hypothetical protein